MNDWSVDGVYYLEGWAWSIDKYLRTICLGKEVDVIKEHPLEIKRASKRRVK